MTKKQIKINPYLLTIISFLVVILIGSFFLSMPFTHNPGIDVGSYIDALFTSVSATCVTGVHTYIKSFADSLNFWGQLVTLIMIQIGGLGFITLLTFFYTLFNKKLAFTERYVVAHAVNATNFADVVKLIRKIMLITAIVETAGFLLGLPVFFTMFKGDPLKALWYSLFHSVSAFNNAGFDLFNNSLVDGLAFGPTIQIAKNSFLYYYFCSYMMILIILGGISFFVIIEIFSFKKRPSQWHAFTKIILTFTAFLIISGTLLLFLTDGIFPKTNGAPRMSFFDCLFQSISARTAGFTTFVQDDISLGGKIISCLLMFTGGAPLGTAGGVKITTIFIIFLAMISSFTGAKLHSFKRSFSFKVVVKAMTLILIAIVVITISYVCINYFGVNSDCSNELINNIDSPLRTDQSFAYLYEIFSCSGTVGFGTRLEPYYTTGSKIVLCLLMFMGRLGPITFFQMFQKNIDKETNKHFDYVEEDILIG